MDKKRKTLEPIEQGTKSLRQRLTLKDELILALMPTITILIVLYLVEELSRQRLLFASLASSAFLIYLDPTHNTNSVKTLIISQMSAAIIGLLTFLLIGPEYLSAGIAMVITIVFMIVFDVMHPPSVATAISFAFRSVDENNLLIFGMAVGITAVLVVLEQISVWIYKRKYNKNRGK